ncbi:MAG: NAD(P)-dependent oxidoreductase [Acetatifactor sp.]|nr:NAD(P)-dependent oxidoreductase [Acetatifactor sp.]
MEKVIVAGAGGFIGKNLVTSLIQRGYEVTALDIKFDDEMKAMAKCISLVDFSKEQLVDALQEEYSCFYDLAWMGTSGSLRGDYNVQLENARITCEYVELAAKVKCSKFIYASSINEIETYEYLQSNDIQPSAGYIYGTGKLAAHLMAETVAYQNGVGFIPVIITNIYGVGEKSARLIYTSIMKLLKGEHCSFTEGYQTYDFIYISDAINSIIEVAEKGKAFNRYYIGSGEPKPLREFLMKMRDIVSPAAELGLGDIVFKGTNVDYKQFAMKQVEKDTGYVNKISFEEGIRMTADYIREEEGL